MNVKIIAYILLCSAILISCRPEQKVMRYTSWQSSPTEEKIIRECLEDFRGVHQDVDFQFQPIPGNYPEKLQLMLGTGNAPDLFWLKADTGPAYMSFDILQELNEYVEQDPNFDLDDFFPVFRDAFKKDGNYYGFAKDFNAYVLFYNKEMFAEAGLDTLPANWEEFRDYAQKLTKDTDGDGKIDQYGFVIEPSIDIMMPFVFQNSGYLISDDNQIGVGNPEFVEAVDYVISLYKENLATTPADQGAGWMGDVFSRGQCAMTISGAWLIPYLAVNAPNLDYGIAELPAGKEKSTVAFSVAMVIPEQSKFKEDAWTLMSYLVGKEGMKTWTNSGIALPTRKSIAEENGFYTDPKFQVFMNSVDYAKLYKVNMKERWFDESQAAMQGILYKDKDIKTTLEQLSLNLEKFKLN